MKYLGIHHLGGIFSAGVYDDGTDAFTQSAYIDIDRILGVLYYRLYKKKPSAIRRFLVEWYGKLLMRRLLWRIDRSGIERVVLSGYMRSNPLLNVTSPLKKKYEGRAIITDHIWSSINAAKRHPTFAYPALVLSSTAPNTVLAYILDKHTIEIIQDRASSPGDDYKGLGFLAINHWVSQLQEDIYWAEQVIPGKKQVYALYRERGKNGKVVIDLKEEIEDSKEPFAEDVLREKLPARMNALRHTYASIEQYKNDWVASQQQALKDIFTAIKKRESSKRKINSYIITGGVSRSPIFEDYSEWLHAPASLCGSESGGNAMAYLGYCIEKEGLKIEHDRWSYR